METDAQARTHTLSHTEAYFCVAEYLGVLARDSGLQGREGVGGAPARLTVIGLGVKWRTAEALAESRGWGGGGDCDFAFRLLCTQGSW